jgi:hypothetical protein
MPKQSLIQQKSYIKAIFKFLLFYNIKPKSIHKYVVQKIDILPYDGLLDRNGRLFKRFNRRNICTIIHHL